MDFNSLKTALRHPKATELSLTFGNDLNIAAHFHITEVGRVTKDFVDCGGVRRSAETCVLQTLVADDIDHRLSPNKLLSILEKSTVLGIEDRIDVEVETQGQTIETYSIAQATVCENVLTLFLAPKSTACLAPDKCGIPDLGILNQECCGGSGVC